MEHLLLNGFDIARGANIFSDATGERITQVGACQCHNLLKFTYDFWMRGGDVVAFARIVLEVEQGQLQRLDAIAMAAGDAANARDFVGEWLKLAPVGGFAEIGRATCRGGE